MKVIDVVRNENLAKFSHYCGGNLYYTVEVDGSTYMFDFKTDPKEIGETAIFYNEMKAITLMKWIRESFDRNEFVKIK
jgi:hypothetical protein